MEMATGTKLRDEGLDGAEDNSGDWFSLAMVILADEIKWLPGEFTSEDIRAAIKRQIGDPPCLNAYGALTMNAVRQKYIEPSGKWVQSKNKQAHSRMIRTYRAL